MGRVVEGDVIIRYTGDGLVGTIASLAGLEGRAGRGRARVEGRWRYMCGADAGAGAG